MSIGSLSESSLSKKSQFSLARAERLKDPKQRTMGIDRSALDEQVREKQALKDLEKERNAFFDQQALLMDKHAVALQQEVNEIRTKREQEVNDYRSTYQKKEARRDFDLYDPQALRKDLPARVSDADPRNGASGLQKFEGEDLDQPNRKALQQEQQRKWAQQQVDEKLTKKWMEGEANRLYEERAEETNYRNFQIEQNIAAQRRQMFVNTADFNKAMAEQKRREQLRDRNLQTQKNLEEIHNMLNSDYLNEREGTVTALGEVVKAERFRGLTAEQRAKIVAEQQRQREELQRRRLQEAEEERQWGQQETMQNRMANALDRQRQRERREEAANLAADLKRQAQEAAEKKSHLDQVYENAVGENYFKHWGNCL
jgi:hypothetical protein